jgi:hypothetical protein
MGFAGFLVDFCIGCGIIAGIGNLPTSGTLYLPGLELSNFSWALAVQPPCAIRYGSEEIMGTKLSWVGTDALFARPSFVSGAARALDLGGTFDDYNRSRSPEDADVRALHSDWMAVGADMQKAIDTTTK